MRAPKAFWTLVLTGSLAWACSAKDRIETCSQDSDCPAGERCIQHLCQPRTGCETDGDCMDAEVCNGEETCDPATRRCQEGSKRPDGFVCLDAPRSICLQGACAASSCGDGFVDASQGESCEPPGQDRCDADCQLLCSADPDCPDDGEVCNGEESCDTISGRCVHLDPLPDGSVCGAEPHKICLSGHCQESTCGDGFVDTGNDEECEDRNNVQGDGCDNDCSYSCHTDPDCDDDSACTHDLCDPATHACRYDLSLANTLCRASGGDCDPQEVCDGVNPGCPQDVLASADTVCRPAVGDCDAQETCTGSSADCPADELLPSLTVCRASAGDCDLEESCDGASPACPEDALAPSSTVCRPAAGLCDVEETCTGSSPACPQDQMKPSTTLCRASAGDCDRTEHCSGSSPDCPADELAAPDQVCRTAAGDCDTGETCLGSSPDCPADELLPASFVCRASAGICDVEERCTGSTIQCPQDGFASPEEVCRAAAGDCDMLETCTGSSPACPFDQMKPATTVCRDAAGICDVEEHCTGSSAGCPQDELVPPDQVCRPPAGDCDALETCTGSSPGCPPDELLPSSAVCRPAASQCDLAELCTGSSPACPEDLTECTYHQRPVSVDNSANTQTLTDYQVLVMLDTGTLIAMGKLQPDCSDIRFVATDGSTFFPYWLESGCDTSTTRFWVRLPSVPGGDTLSLLIRYGDTGWPSQSSLPDAFLAGSDFDSDDGFIFVEDGVMESFGNASGNLQSGFDALSFVSLNRLENTYAYQQLPAAMSDGYAIRARVKVTSEPAEDGRYVQPLAVSQSATTALSASDQYALEVCWVSGMGWNIIEDVGTSYYDSANIYTPVGSWYILELTKSGSTANLRVYDDAYVYQGSASLTLTSPSATRSYLHAYLKRASDWTSLSSSGLQDWSLVRRYSNPEPIISVGPED